VETRVGAVQALGKMGPAAKPTVPDLVRLLADEEWDVRQEAAAALKKIDPKALPKSEK
jgi:HEAT repeat protein